MSYRKALRWLLLAVSCNLAFFLHAAEPTTVSPAPAGKPEAADNADKSTKTFTPLSPGPTDGQIAYATVRILEKYQYLRTNFNARLAGKFLDRYLETLDPMHLHFTQADLAEFEHYRTELDRLTLPPSNIADTRPAYEIFNRFVERFQQHVALVDDLLKNEKFTFDTDERILLNRKDQPYPKDLAEAKQLWRDRLRFEYLQEKLGKIDAKKKPASASKTEQADKTAGANAKPKKSDAEEIVDTLSHRYHRQLHMFVDWDSDDVLQLYLTTLAHVYDPHSDYLGKASLDSFTILMNLSLYGIGAELMLEDGYCTINRLLPGGPAIKSKQIHEKDRIIEVAQSNQPPVDVIDMSLNKAVSLIRGPKGTEVRLTIIPAGADSASRKQVTLVRDEIPLEDQAAKAKIIELPDDHGQPVRLGVIDLPSFYAPFDPSNSRDKSGPKSSTTEDVAKLLTKLKQENVKGVILDLRHNGGGSLEEAIKLTGLFVKEGPVVQVRAYDGSVQEDDIPEPLLLYDGPLIVMTSRQSASASEIVAGALQDYGRALVVGDSSTHGKGTVQTVQPLRDLIRIRGRALTNDPGALKLTIKKFYRASGASTQLKGVVPDIILPSVLNEAKEIGESALESALEWDTIPSAKYNRLNLVEPYLPDLRQRSAQRVAADKEFSYTREDIERYKKRQADKTYTLNEKEALREKDQDEARDKAREQERKERLARNAAQEKVYELTLKQASLPGLPPPVGKTNSTIAKVQVNPGLSAAGGETASAEHVKNTKVTTTSSSETPDENADEEKAPAADANLTESEHILMDYLSLLPKNSVAAAGAKPPLQASPLPGASVATP
jgi:carboxyl-terminal processing protease